MSNAAIFSISLSRQPKASLVQQLYEALVERIADGKIVPGFRLPSTRQFAMELGVSRSTVISAYDQLVAEGYLQPRPGSGLYVLDIGTRSQGRAGRSPRPGQDVSVRAPRRPQPFVNGLPDMRLFPYRAWGRQVARVARHMPWAFVENESGFGDPGLRLEVSRHLREWRGIEADPEQIIITAGASDAIELTLRSLTVPGNRIALENPGYAPLTRMVDVHGAEPVWMNVDQQGADPAGAFESDDRVKLAILTPSYQFPLGVTMTTSRKNRFLHLAARNNSWILEDDFDSEFRYSGLPVTSLASLDRLNRVIYVGSFSKIFSSGLRIGFMAVPHLLLSRVAETLAAFGSRASSAPQRALAGFMEEGEFHRHLRRMRRIYAARRQYFLHLINGHFGHSISYHDNPAGMQIALHLPTWFPDRAFSEESQNMGLSCAALSNYYHGSSGSRGLLLGFCAFSEEEMSVPMEKMAVLLAKIHAQNSGYAE